MSYEIRTAAVIGAGTMGLGIAGQLANAGVDVVLLDVPAQGPDRNAIAARAIERLLDESRPGLLHESLQDHITIGNIEDDLGRICDADWIAEAVVERLDIKRALYKQIDAVRKSRSIVSSNTSTIPISLLVEDMPGAFREEFAITHFFNPVRYMRLLELVKGESTKPEVIGSLEAFGDGTLGKGVVTCNDTPGFLANRVGVFAMQKALHAAFDMGLSPEQADAVFGRPLGIPKTGVFGLYDLIGIDLMSDVVASLESTLPADDPFHGVSATVPAVARMIDHGLIGDKGGEGGFYQPARPADDSGRKTLDFASFEYRDFEPCKLQEAIDAELSGDFNDLLELDTKLGAYAWDVLSNTLCYAASLVPDVNESLVAIDDAMKLGYNWMRGPFEMVDVIGVDRFIARLESEGRDVPAFLRVAAGESFYRARKRKLRYLESDGRFSRLKRAKGVRRFSELRRTLKPIEENAAASYYELKHEVGIVEFHSKANALGPESMALLEAAVAHAGSNLGGLIIHNDAQHFSCGANLESILGFVVDDDMAGLDAFLNHYQQTLASMRNAPIPVVAAPSGLSVGGGFEVLLHTDKVVYHANSITGLVETVVGVVPGGGGVKEMLYRWYEREGDIIKAAWNAFMNIGCGKTARSPLEAEPLAMFRNGVDEYIMNRDRLLGTAMKRVVAMRDGYVVEEKAPLAMPGRDVWAEMLAWLENARGEGKLTPHDVTTGAQIAMVVTGGDMDAGAELSENDLFDLERAAFTTLGRTAETRARIEFMLEHGTALRN